MYFVWLLFTCADKENKTIYKIMNCSFMQSLGLNMKEQEAKCASERLQLLIDAFLSPVLSPGS